MKSEVMQRLRIGLACILALHGSALLLSAERNLSTALLEEWAKGPRTQIGGTESGKCLWKDGSSVAFDFDFTSKGNGSLLMGGQLIRIWDSHGDGCSYAEGMLRIDLALESKTPLLILSGLAEWTDDKGRAVIKREPILVILALNKRKQLEIVFENQGAVHSEVIRTDDPEKKRMSQSEWTNIIQRKSEP